MSRSDDLRVADILEAAGQIAELVAGGRESFDSDWTRRRATERLLEIRLGSDFRMIVAAHPLLQTLEIVCGETSAMAAISRNDAPLACANLMAVCH